MDVNYKFKLKPFNHQLEALKLGWDRQEFGLFMEMGTGKSKVLIDNMGMLYLAGKINFALVIAPKGVYRNWVSKEIPEHMSDDVPHRVIRWVASPNKSQQEEMRSVKDKFDGLTIFVMNVESFSTPKGRNGGEWMARNLGARGMIATMTIAPFRSFQIMSWGIPLALMLPSAISMAMAISMHGSQTTSVSLTGSGSTTG